MNCFKCRKTLKSNEFVCKSCKTQVKAKCSKCESIEQDLICSKCKNIIFTLCPKCNTKNHSLLKNCSKCRGKLPEIKNLKKVYNPTYAALGIRFANLTKIKLTIPKQQMFFEILALLSQVIVSKSNEFETEILKYSEDTFLIKFNGASNIEDSVLQAINCNNILFNAFYKINHNFNEKLKLKLKIKMGLALNSIYSGDELPFNEFNVQLNKDIQIITNSDISGKAEAYKFKHILTIPLDGKEKHLYELDFPAPEIKKETKKNKENFQIQQLPGFIEEERFVQSQKKFPELEFKDKKSSIIYLGQHEAETKISEIIKSSPKSFLLNIISSKKFGKSECLNFETLSKNVNNSLFYKIKCTPHSSKTPFYFFREVFKSFYDLSDLENTFMPVKRKSIQSYMGMSYPCIKNLLFLNKVKKSSESFNFKEQLFKEIKEFFTKNTEKIIFWAEDFDFIDEGSLECLEYLLENNFELSNFKFLIFTEKDYNLFKKIPFINKIENYKEIYFRSLERDEIIDKINLDNSVEESFLFNKVLSYSSGSLFYVKTAISYLILNDIWTLKNDKIYSKFEKAINIPFEIERILENIYKIFFKDPHAKTLLIKLYLFGFKTDIPVLKSKILNDDEILALKRLLSLNLAEILNNKFISLRYYNILEDIINKNITQEEIQNTAAEIYLNLFEQNMHRELVLPYDFINIIQKKGVGKNAIVLLENLAQVAISLDDVTAYSDCTEEYLKLFEKAFKNNRTKELTEQQFKDITVESYNILSSLLSEDYPEKAFPFLEKMIAIRENEEPQNSEELVKLYIMILKSLNTTGDYKKSLQYIDKMAASLPRAYFDRNSQDFNLKYYSLYYLRLLPLFNTGQFDQCLEQGNEIIITLEFIQQNPKLISKYPKSLFDCMIKEAYFSVAKCLLIKCSENFLGFIEEVKVKYPEPLTDILKTGYYILKNPEDEKAPKIKDLFESPNLNNIEKITSGLLYTIYAMQQNNWNLASNLAYSTSFLSRKSKDYLSLYFFDLVIARGYKEINNLFKAKDIYGKTLKLGADRNMLIIMLLSWYFIADLELSEKNPDNALEIIKKASLVIQRTNISKIFALIFKELTFKVFIAKENYLNAKKTLELVIQIKKDLSLSYDENFYHNLIEDLEKKLLEV